MRTLRRPESVCGGSDEEGDSGERVGEGEDVRRGRDIEKYCIKEGRTTRARVNGDMLRLRGRTGRVLSLGIPLSMPGILAEESVVFVCFRQLITSCTRNVTRVTYFFQAIVFRNFLLSCT
jgi:hypothetical protein